MSYLDVTSIDFVREILENFEDFKKEFKKVEFFNINTDKLQSSTKYDEILYTGKIKTYMFKIDEQLLDYKEKKIFLDNKERYLTAFKRNRYESPVHKNLLRKYPYIRQLFYNVIYPSAKINPHHGVNGLDAGGHPDHFRIHITVESGDESYFYIEGLPPLHYKKGLVFGFHDGLVKHWAENKGLLSRSVLILDVDKSVVPDNLAVIDERFFS
jgi:hypothetical protein